MFSNRQNFRRTIRMFLSHLKTRHEYGLPLHFAFWRMGHVLYTKAYSLSLKGTPALWKVSTTLFRLIFSTTQCCQTLDIVFSETLRIETKVYDCDGPYYSRLLFNRIKNKHLAYIYCMYYMSPCTLYAKIVRNNPTITHKHSRDSMLNTIEGS